MPRIDLTGFLMHFVIPDLFIKTGVHFAFGIWKGYKTDKANFGFVKFCNVNEWMLEHIKGKEHCK